MIGIPYKNGWMEPMAMKKGRGTRGRGHPKPMSRTSERTKDHTKVVKPFVWPFPTEKCSWKWTNLCGMGWYRIIDQSVLLRKTDQSDGGWSEAIWIIGTVERLIGRILIFNEVRLEWVNAWKWSKKWSQWPERANGDQIGEQMIGIMAAGEMIAMITWSAIMKVISDHVINYGDNFWFLKIMAISIDFDRGEQRSERVVIGVIQEDLWWSERVKVIGMMEWRAQGDQRGCKWSEWSRRPKMLWSGLVRWALVVFMRWSGRPKVIWMIEAIGGLSLVIKAIGDRP